MNNKIQKMIVGSVLTVGMMSSLFTSSLAVDIAGTNGQGELSINVDPTMLSATVPTTIAANIDPNKKVIDYEGNQTTDTTDTFISPNFTIKNNGNAPIKIAIKSITASTGMPNVRKHDVFTDDAWKNLNKAQSSQNIAFGFILDNKSQWQNVSNENGWYNPEDASDYEFGTIAGNSSAQVRLKSKYGLAFGNSTTKTINYNVVYEIALA